MGQQPFKLNDEKEEKVRDAALPVLTLLGNERDAFYAGAFEAFPLGGVLFDLRRAPLAGAISRENYIQCFFAIYDLFTRPGTFEFYLALFRAIWGPDVEVEFTIPAPGQLGINISALTVQLYNFVARDIVDNAYVYDEVVDQDGDNIVFQVNAGIKTQSETDALLRELHPYGIYVTSTLTVV